MVDDQPSERNRHDCAHHRESKPVSSVLAPNGITEAPELWAGPLNHDDLIGTLFVKLYEHSTAVCRACLALCRQEVEPSFSGSPGEPGYGR